MSELIFYDVPRTLVLNIISILFLYFGVIRHKEKYYILYPAFSALLVFPFLLIILTGIAFTNFDLEVVKELFLWSFKWIAYFIAMFGIQHIIFICAKKLSNPAKIALCILLFIFSLNFSLKLVLPHIVL